MRKSCLIFTFIFSSFSILTASDFSINDYLKGWLENDRDIKNATISLQNAELSNEKLSLQNGFDITLSSGTMTFKTTNGSGTFTISPSVKATLPSFRNLSFSAGTDITISDNTKLENASLNASIDLIDTEKEKRELSEKKSLRSILEAKRVIEDKVRNSEKSFYQNIQSLLKSYSSIINSKNNLYSDKINFEKTKAQGYSANSSNYRLSEMKVKNDQHNIETAERSLSHDFKNFLMKCFVNLEELEKQNITLDDFILLASQSIDSPEPQSFESFSKDTFKEIEKAIWNNEINSLSRSSAKSYSLKGSAGYTFRNSNIKDGNNKISDSIDAGITSSVLGMSLSAGISLPVNPGAAPSFTAGISFSPNTLKKQNIENLEKSLDEQSDLLSLETAYYNYDLSSADKKQKLEDLLWEKSTISENLLMYTQTEKDMKYYFDRGIITESEYLSAKTNKEKYEIEQLLNNLDLIIYNCEIQSLFYEN